MPSNVLNQANFNTPTSGLNSANVGPIVTAGQPRSVVFALQYDF